MSGYHGFSKSNNAILAEENGEFPATIAAKKLGVSAAALKFYLTPCAWHHTGKMYRCTNYYDISRFLDVDLDDDDRELLAKMKSYKVEKATETFRANVKFLTWEGTRNHPKAIEHSAENVEVEKRGKKYIIKMPDGIYNKMEGSNGTFIYKLN